MSELPQASAADLVRALEKLVFTVRRQQSSHMIMRRAAPFAQTLVPEGAGFKITICDLEGGLA